MYLRRNKLSAIERNADGHGEDQKRSRRAPSTIRQQNTTICNSLSLALRRASAQVDETEAPTSEQFELLKTVCDRMLLEFQIAKDWICLKDMPKELSLIVHCWPFVMEVLEQAKAS